MFRGLFERSGVLIAAAVGVISGVYIFDGPLREAAAARNKPPKAAGERSAW